MIKNNKNIITNYDTENYYDIQNPEITDIKEIILIKCNKLCDEKKMRTIKLNEIYKTYPYDDKNHKYDKYISIRTGTSPTGKIIAIEHTINPMKIKISKINLNYKKMEIKITMTINLTDKNRILNTKYQRPNSYDYTFKLFDIQNNINNTDNLLKDYFYFDTGIFGYKKDPYLFDTINLTLWGDNSIFK